MVGACCPILGVDWVAAEGRVGDEHADAGVETSGECAADIVGGLVEEGGELRLVGRVEEEVAEAVVRVHDLDLGEVVVAVEGEGMEDDVRVDRVCFAGAGEVAVLDVGGNTLFGCFSGDGDLFLLVFCR